MVDMEARDGRKISHEALEEIRIRAVQQVEAGESPEAVIKALGFDRTCIYRWIAAYREGGLDALKAKKLEGRPRKLSGKQIQKLYNLIVKNSPLQFRFAYALWTAGIIREFRRSAIRGLRLAVAQETWSIAPETAIPGVSAGSRQGGGLSERRVSQDQETREGQKSAPILR